MQMSLVRDGWKEIKPKMTLDKTHMGSQNVSLMALIWFLRKVKGLE